MMQYGNDDEVIIKNTKILGLNNWDPTGESIISILNRIAFANQFCWREIKKLFFNSTHITQNKLNPSDSEGLSYFYIKQLFKRHEKDIQKSFIKYYFDVHFLSLIDSNHLYESQIRICPICAAAGKHLIIHQLSQFHKCPIHKKLLTNRCLNCDAQLEKFSIDSEQTSNEDMYVKFTCRDCGFENLTQPNRLDSKTTALLNKHIKALFASLDTWLGNNEHFVSNCYWLGGLINVNPYLLFATTTTIEPFRKDCLVKPLPYNYKQYIYKSKEQKSLPLHPRSVDTLIMLIIRKSLIHRDYLKKKFNVTEHQQKNAHILSEFNSLILGNRDYSIWAAAVENLLFFITSRTNKKLYKIDVELEQGSYIVKNWSNTFRHYLSRQDKVDFEILTKISLIWVRYYVEQVFYYLVYKYALDSVNVVKKTESSSINKFAQNTFALSVDKVLHDDHLTIHIWFSNTLKNQLNTLFEKGFLGYTKNKRKQYFFYKKLFALNFPKQTVLSEKDYFLTLDSREQIRICSETNDGLSINILNHHVSKWASDIRRAFRDQQIGGKYR